MWFQTFFFVMSTVYDFCKKWELECYGIDKQTIQHHNVAIAALTGYLIGLSILCTIY